MRLWYLGPESLTQRVCRTLLQHVDGGIRKPLSNGIGGVRGGERSIFASAHWQGLCRVVLGGVEDAVPTSAQDVISERARRRKTSKDSPVEAAITRHPSIVKDWPCMIGSNSEIAGTSARAVNPTVTRMITCDYSPLAIVRFTIDDATASSNSRYQGSLCHPSLSSSFSSSSLSSLTSPSFPASRCLHTGRFNDDDDLGACLPAQPNGKSMMRKPTMTPSSVMSSSRGLLQAHNLFCSHSGFASRQLDVHASLDAFCRVRCISMSASSSFYSYAVVTGESKNDEREGVESDEPCMKKFAASAKRESLGPGLDPDVKAEELEDSEGAKADGDIPMAWGRVHSIESFSAIDGPGIRSVIFLQGCWRRCLFCSNPDTWSPMTEHTKRMSSKDIAKRLQRNLPYYSGGGGVTLSGGEPLLQAEFCAAIFREAHAMGISTALDTAGYGRSEEWARVLPHTDTVMLCLKAIDTGTYHKLVGLSNSVVLKFVEAIQQYKVPLVIRFVLLPGYTDTKEEIEGLIKFAKSQDTLVGVEILPYHTLGVNKWKELGLSYPLEGVSPPSKEFMDDVKMRIEDAGIKTLM